MLATADLRSPEVRMARPQPQPAQNVLLVSHDPMETDRYSACLDNSYHLFLAGTERRVFSLLDSQVIDVIIINTRGTNTADGIRLCSRLKSTPRSAHLPVILLIPGRYPETRISDPEARIGGLKAGADACLEKPLSRDHLNAQVGNLLGNRDRLKSYFSQPFVPQLGPAAGTKENQAFVSRLNGFISANLHDAELNVDGLSQMMNMSRATLYRRIRYVYKRTPNRLVNFIRLNKAAELLSAGEGKVFEIAQRVGFSSRGNFGKAFLKQFGLTPKVYGQMMRESAVFLQSIA